MQAAALLFKNLAVPIKNVFSKEKKEKKTDFMEDVGVVQPRADATVVNVDLSGQCVPRE